MFELNKMLHFILDVSYILSHNKHSKILNKRHTKIMLNNMHTRTFIS